VSGPAVAATFAEHFGSPPDGVWSAPGRVNLIGEHTDYNQGLCLPMALPHRTSVAARLCVDRTVRVWSVQSGELVTVDLDDVAPGIPSGWAAYVAGVFWALEQAGHRVAGADLAVDGRVPLGAGLSSSAALECAVAVALSDLCGLALARDDASRTSLAAICANAENTIARAPTGGMDQSASLRCTEGHALRLDCRDGSVEQVPFDLAAHDLALLVMDTRAEHALVDGQYAERRRSCEKAAAELGVTSLREVPFGSLDAALARLVDPVVRRRARHVVTEIERVRATVALLREDRVEEVGPLFDASHLSMRDDFEISCAELDVAVETATAHGALGARMTGGGFGGSAIAIVPAGAVDQVSEAVAKAFAQHGFDSPSCFAVTASGAAGRDA
jgi:galactokinase